jgi:hypothetical protein
VSISGWRTKEEETTCQGIANCSRQCGMSFFKQSPVLALENQKSGKPMGFMRKANKLSPKKHT